MCSGATDGTVLNMTWEKPIRKDPIVKADRQVLTRSTRMKAGLGGISSKIALAAAAAAKIQANAEKHQNTKFSSSEQSAATKTRAEKEQE